MRVLPSDGQPTLPDRTPAKMLTNVNNSTAIRPDCGPATTKFPTYKMLANVGFSAAVFAGNSLTAARVVLSKMLSNVDISAAIHDACDEFLDEESPPTLLDPHRSWR